MKLNRIWLSLFLAIALVMFYAGGSAMAGEHDHGIKTGKKGETTFKSPTKIGDFLLEPGRYKFQHRADGGSHFVHFTSLKSRKDSVDVECKLEPLNSKSKYTGVTVIDEGGIRRVTRLQVRGENVAHLF